MMILVTVAAQETKVMITIIVTMNQMVRFVSNTTGFLLTANFLEIGGRFNSHQKVATGLEVDQIGGEKVNDYDDEINTEDDDGDYDDDDIDSENDDGDYESDG